MVKYSKKEGVMNTLLKGIDFPLNLLRDYTVPPPGEDDWDRTRASITPVTMTFAFFWLNAGLF